MDYQQNLHMSLDDMDDQKKGGKSHAVKSYRRYFEGFSEYRVTTNGGKTKIIREYTEDYYRLNKKDGTWYRTKAAYAVIMIVDVILFVNAVLHNFMGHGSKINALAEGISVMMLAWMMIATVNYLMAKRMMTIYIYKVSSISLIRASLFCAITLFSTAIITGGSIIAYWDGMESLYGLITLLEYTAIGFLSLAVYIHEKKATYIKVAKE